jgi:HAD superfamily hydrolase (TIGR01509 family)
VKAREQMTTPREFRAIIFDLDGVIVDSEPCHERAFRDVFHQLGYGEKHGIDFEAYYGRSDRALWLDFIDLHQPACSIEELIDLKQRRFMEMLDLKQPIFAGLPELVEKLSRRYKLAVASGSFHPVIGQVLAMRGLRPFFSAVVSVQDVPQGKPAPDVFLRAAELLELSPAECWVIEDAAAGVEAALSAGMSVIGITNTLEAEKLARATHVVRTYGEIERLLL